MYPRDPEQETTLQRMLPGILFVVLPLTLYIFWVGSFEKRDFYTGRIRFIFRAKGEAFVTCTNWDRLLLPFAEDSFGLTLNEFFASGDSLSLKDSVVTVFKENEVRAFRTGR
jgi:hypothetical protein